MAGVPRNKKSQCRQLADMLAAYGSGILPAHADLTYADWVGLWLNLERVRKRQAIAVAEGTVAGSSANGLDSSWADALALVDEVVEMLHHDINAARATARVRSKLGMPRG